MVTTFDVLSTVFFLGTAIGFFQLTDRAIKTLLHLTAPGIAFAMGNQLGNAGYTALASFLLLAGVVYAGLILWQNPS
jgi:hypothetical protein